MPRTATGSLEIIAHRCSGFGHPEQSPRAIRAAIDANASVHLSARLTKNRSWVVILGPENEPTVRRVHTMSAIRAIVAPLEHALAIIAASADSTRPLYLEVKDTGNERDLLKMLTRLDLIDRTVLIAWDPQSLARAHAIEPRLRLGLAFVPLERSLRRPHAIVHKIHPRARVTLAYDVTQRFDTLPGLGATPVHTLSHPDVTGVPLAAVFVPALLARKKTVAQAHARGARLFAWGVHNRFLLRVLAQREVDGILTDHARNLVRP